MTISEVLICIDAHIESEQEMALNQLRAARIISYTIAAANRDPKKAFPTIEKYMPLPGDSEPMTKESRKELIERKRREREILKAKKKHI